MDNLTWKKIEIVVLAIGTSTTWATYSHDILLGFCILLSILLYAKIHLAANSP